MWVVSWDPNQVSGLLSQGSQIESLTVPPRFLFFTTPPGAGTHSFQSLLHSRRGQLGSRTVPGEGREWRAQDPAAHQQSRRGPFESVPLWHQKKKRKKKLIPQSPTWQEAASLKKSALSLQLCGHLGHEPTGSYVRQSNKWGGGRQEKKKALQDILGHFGIF